jgi:hypothetical protein
MGWGGGVNFNVYMNEECSLDNLDYTALLYTGTFDTVHVFQNNEQERSCMVKCSAEITFTDQLHVNIINSSGNTLKLLIIQKNSDNQQEMKMCHMAEEMKLMQLWEPPTVPNRQSCSILIDRQS